MSKAVPELRFPGFKGEWQTKSVGRLLKRASDPVRVEPEETYREIGVRSHGRGVFHKAPVSGAELGDKRVFHVVPDALVLNIVFAWEQAVAMTSSDEQGFIASHRFPMFLENAGQSYLPFIRQLLLTPRGKMLLEIASPGGAGRNKTLGQDAFLKLKTRVPERDEQKRIADLLDVTSRKVALLTDKKTALEDYKRGLMQRLFSRELRFTREDGSAFPDWEEKKLSSILVEHRQKSDGTEVVHSVSVVHGLIDQVAHLGRSYAAESTLHYNRVNPGDIVYTKSPTGKFPFGIIKQSQISYSAIVSPLYGVFQPKSHLVGMFLDVFFSSESNTEKFLRPLVNKGPRTQ